MVLIYNTSLAHLGDIHNRYDEFHPQFSRITGLHPHEYAQPEGSLSGSRGKCPCQPPQRI